LVEDVASFVSLAGSFVVCLFIFIFILYMVCFYHVSMDVVVGNVLCQFYVKDIKF